MTTRQLACPDGSDSIVRRCQLYVWASPESGRKIYEYTPYYHVVKVKEDPETAAVIRLAAPPGREGDFALKHFLLRKVGRQQTREPQ